MVIFKHNNSIYDFFCWFFVLCLISVALLTGYEWSVSGFTLTPERVMAVPLVILTVLWFIAWNKEFSLTHSFSLAHSTVMLTLWLLWAFFPSAFSSVPVWSLKMYSVLLIAVSYYYVVLFVQVNPFSVFNSKVFLLIAWFFGPVLSVLYLMNFFGFDLPSVVTHWFPEGGGGARVRGTFYEPNLFGAFLTLFILVVFAINKNRQVWWWLLILGLHISLIFSFSRSPWAAYVSAVFFYLILKHPDRLSFRDIAKYFVVTLFLLVILSVVTYLIVMLMQDEITVIMQDEQVTANSHLNQVGELVGRTHSIRTRFTMWSLAFESISKAPFLGNGIFSFSALYPDSPSLVGSDTYRSAWISNLPLAVLHDTGVVGVMLFIAFIVGLLKNAWVSVRTESMGHSLTRNNVNIGAALLASLISLMISSLTIPAHSLALFWVVIALLTRFIIMTKERRD